MTTLFLNEILYINVCVLCYVMMLQRVTNNVKELRIISQRATYYVKLLRNYVMEHFKPVGACDTVYKNKVKSQIC
jgi:hypothetical protein